MRRLHLREFRGTGHHHPAHHHPARHLAARIGLLWLGLVILLLAFSSFSAASAATACSAIEHPKCRVQLITGTSMTYLELGVPKPGEEPSDTVILIHGLTDSARSWWPTALALHKLNPTLHIYAIDQRGHGDSSMPPVAACAPAPEKCFRMEDFAADLVSFMQVKRIRKATLAGHSLGSFVVQEMALAHPELVERAILVATSTKGVDNVALRDYVLKEPVEGQWRKDLEAKGKVYPDDFYTLRPIDAEHAARDWIAKNWVVDPAADPAFLKPYVGETANVKLGTWIGATKALLATDNTTRLLKLSVPTLVLWGSQDNIFLADPDQVAVKSVLHDAAVRQNIIVYWKQYGLKKLPASGMQEDDIGHNVQWAAPEQVAEDINAYIATGKPLPGVPFSDSPPHVDRILVDKNRSLIEKYP
jgi:pimeloyl-ACP methyl ester carboxylesterase